MLNVQSSSLRQFLTRNSIETHLEFARLADAKPFPDSIETALLER